MKQPITANAVRVHPPILHLLTFWDAQGFAPYAGAEMQNSNEYHTV